MNILKFASTTLLLGTALLLASCSESLVTPSGSLAGQAALFPDYDGVTIPYNIAPLNQSVEGEGLHCMIIEGGGLRIQVMEDDAHFEIPEKEWHELLSKVRGSDITVTIARKDQDVWKSYEPYSIHVAQEPIDPYMVYRLIPTRYSQYLMMGIYQRDLTSFKESPVYENKLTESNCVNCHTFPMNSPDKMILHLRGKYASTLLVDGDKVRKLNTKTAETISAFVYPSWHPGGELIAFSNNMTSQDFFLHSQNILEVYDSKSDIVVYDVRSNEVFSSPLLKGDDAMETYPCFSPDGKSLYFCSSRPVDQMPEDYQKAEYDLLRIDFDPSSRTFGSTVDTIFSASSIGKSVSFDKVSPDGRYLAFTLQDYGTFAEWHPDSDIYIVDLSSGEVREMDNINSDRADGYHSWGSNSRWMAFSSRRVDGNYTMPYLTYVDGSGHSCKPFLLPQKNPAKHYRDIMSSYNLPELVTSKVKADSYLMGLTAREEAGEDVRYVGHDKGDVQQEAASAGSGVN